MKNKFYVTTPIYYVNDKPHIGHTYTTVAADVLSRYHKLIGDETFFLTGTDEHGAKVAEKAAKEGKDPQVFTDDIAAQFKNAWRELNIDNDNFLRTTDKAHMEAVQNALRIIFDNGDIYKGSYTGLYCRGCEQYKNEKDLIDGKCPDHGIVPEKMSEESYMFRLSKYADNLLQQIEKDKFMIRPKERRNEVINFYKNEGLNDISFSRKNVAWGITIPWDRSHTAYVWADAFLNYLTGLGWAGEASLRGDVKRFFPPDIQLMSKDILRVHATIWPAMLLSLGLPLPKSIFVHGYFLIDGQKMSKSIGNVIAPEDLVNRYGVDATRYLLMSATTFGQDGDISWNKFDEKYNADLANGIGNLVARVSNLIERNDFKYDFKNKTDLGLANDFNYHMGMNRLNVALENLWRRLKAVDEYLSEQAPWKIDDQDKKRKILHNAGQDIFNVAYLLRPFLPATAEKIIKQFSAGRIKKGEPLFPRLA